MSEQMNVPPSVNLLDPAVVEEWAKRQAEPPRAIPTPLPSLNAVCRDEGGGIGPALGWQLIAAGRPGSGKSGMCGNFAGRAVHEGYAVGIISLEMGMYQWATREYAQITNTPLRELERGSGFSSDSAALVAERTAEISRGGSLYINSEPLAGIHEILELMRFWCEERFVRFIVVDYMQLANAWDAASEREEVSRVSSMTRQFASEYECLVLGVSQFNRSTSSNRYESPTAQGLMGSSSLENDADMVLLLDHSRYERERRPDGDIARTYLVIDKNRHGPVGQVPICWDYKTLRIREGLPDEDHLWPERKAA